MDDILQTTPVNVRAHRVGRLAIVLTLAAVLLAFLVAPAIHAAGTVRVVHLVNTVQTAGLTQYLFATAAAGIRGAGVMLVSFALAFSVGILVLGTAELVWRYSRRPGSQL